MDHHRRSNDQVVPSPSDDPGVPPPGQLLTPRFTKADVLGSLEAAAARGVSLDHELKTLVLTTSGGPMAVSLLASSRLSLRAMKKKFDADQAYLMSRADLADLGLAPGIICPILNPVWSMPQVVSPQVLAKSCVTINNGTTRGYFTFAPRILLDAPQITTADVEQTID